MARGDREILLTHADQALNDIRRAIENLTFMRDKYGDVHPSEAAVCQLMIDYQEQAALTLVQFQKERM